MTLSQFFFNPLSPWYYLLRWMVLVLLGLAVYGQTFGFHFVFDDHYYLLDTPYIRSFENVNQIWETLPKTRLVGIYSFALNYYLHQLNPSGYHIFNFLVHLLATGLVWGLAGLLFRIAARSSKWAHPQLPFIMALLFLVHPCQTQAVTYIAQRFESMATVFYLACLYCYLQARIAVLARRKLIFFSGTFLFAIVGVLTKETAVTIPLMLLACEWIIFKNRSRYLYSIVGLGIVLVLLVMNILRVNPLDLYLHFEEPSASHQGDIITGGNYVLTQLRVFLTFLRLLILPVNQNLYYDYPLSTGLLEPPLTCLGLGVIVMMIILIGKLRHQWPLMALGLAWMLITFSINTVPRIHVIFEHKLYLISFGFLLVAVSGWSMIIQKRQVLFEILGVWIIVLALLSFQRNQVWQNELTLWRDVVQKSPQQAAAYNSLAVALARQGDFKQALANFDKSITLNPKEASFYNNRGNALIKQERFAEALADLNKAIEINPNYSQAFSNRGSVYEFQGDLLKALDDYNKAIALNRYNLDAYHRRGLILAKQAQWAQATADFNQAIAINPQHVESYVNRAIIQAQQSQFTQALADYDKAISINPFYASAYVNRGILYAQQGLFSQSLKDYDQAIRLNPYLKGVYYNRAVIYYQLKEYNRAWEDLQQAQALGSPINPQFLDSLKKASGKS